MPMPVEKRGVAAWNFVLVGTGCLVISGLAIGCNSSVRAPTVLPGSGKGDTPVVLVGGSITFNQNSSIGGIWTGPTSGVYQTAGASPVTMIVVKSKADGGSDSNPTTDRLVVAVPANKPWELDLHTDVFTQTPGVKIYNLDGSSTIKASLYTAANGGSLCLSSDKTALYFGNSTCPDKGTKFTSMDVIVGGIPVGSLSCYSTDQGPQTCRVVFRAD
jgi:hypothetical protein